MRSRHGGRRGLSALYLIVVMVVLCGLCSFGVDLGRVHVVKGQLQNSADAGARAGVSAVPGDLVAARARAAEFAAYHRADGKPVLLEPGSDVEFGRWDEPSGQFQVLSGSALSRADAIRVTARRTRARGNATPLVFGAILGVKTCDATASAVARILPPPASMNIVGLNFVTLKGSDRIDRYNSDLGPYSAINSEAGVNVGSNGAISAGGSSQIRGNAYIGPSGSATGNISGSITTLADPLAYPPAKLSGIYTSHGAIALKSGETLTLTRGKHYCTSLSLSGNAMLNVSGNVKLYVQGAINIDGNTEIATAGNSPGNLEIYVLGSGPINLGKNNLYASIYAPNSPLLMNGNSNLFGSVVAASISMNGSNTIHYDMALAPAANGPAQILLVK